MSEVPSWRSFATHLQCTRCDQTFDLAQLWNLCTCGAPLSTQYDLGAASTHWNRAELPTRASDLWRYREMLPLQQARNQVALGEGMTPLLDMPRLSQRLGGRRVLMKDESLNPTNSFKARGMAVAVSRALELGCSHLALPSAGNAGGALAAYAARAGLGATVFIPADTPAAFADECRAHGAHVERVDGLIDDCGRLVAAGAATQGWFNMSTLKEPYRLEGKKTLGYELAEQLGWHLPDVVVYPTGGGTGLVGMWKAFAELHELGWVTERAPHLWCVQTEGCAPIVRAFHAGAETAATWENAHTFALGLRVPAAVGDFLMLRALRETDGAAVSVHDDEIAAAGRELAEEEGVFASPEGAATWAALRRSEKILGDAETLVLFNTGGWYKYADGWRHALGF